MKTLGKYLLAIVNPKFVVIFFFPSRRIMCFFAFIFIIMPNYLI